MKLLHIWFAFGLLISLNSCLTPYKAFGLKGGYKDVRISENAYRVDFTGNVFTDANRTSTFILRRCAELTLEKGKRYFRMVENETTSQTSGSVSYYGGAIATMNTSRAQFTILDTKEEGDNIMDAVLIIRDTDKVAKGRISEKALMTLEGFEGKRGQGY